MIDMFDKLSEPFPPGAISWRVGSTNADKTSGMALAYLDARDVMDRLDSVCGPAGWQCRYPHANGKTVCEIGVRVYLPDPSRQLDMPEWIWKSDGAGDTDYEADKGALSDAFKRAAVRFGIGRYLYSLPTPWVNITVKGKTAYINKDQEPKLRKLLADYTGVSRKSSAQSNRDKDFEHFKARLENAADLEDLGAIGREIKEALPSLPVAVRDPLQDAYLSRREELLNLHKDAA